MTRNAAAVPNTIEREVVLAAPQERVWSAISDPDGFGAWSGMRFDDPFVPGERVRAHLVAAAGDSDESVGVEWRIGRMEPQRLFSYHWHPFPVDHSRNYSGEPMNTIEITLRPQGDGTRLRVVESGYDTIPADRRAVAYRGNADGWDLQLANLARYLIAAGTD